MNYSLMHLNAKILILVFLFFSCNKDTEEPQTSAPDPSPPDVVVPSTAYLSGVQIEGDFYGEIRDYSGTPTTVTIGNKSADVDANGRYILLDALVDSMRAEIVLESPGLRPQRDVFYPSSQSLLKLRTMDEPVEGVQYPNASASFDLEECTIEENSLANVNGDVYSGPCQVYTRTISYFSGGEDLLPGDYLGTDLNGELKFLFPYGATNVDFIDVTGESLDLAEGVSIPLRFQSTLAFQQPSFSLWHYDIEGTVWREIGTAEGSNSFEYFADVDRLGWFMIAITFDPIRLSGRVLSSETETPLASMRVGVEGPQQQIWGTITDQKGFFSFWAPAEFMVDFQVRNQCFLQFENSSQSYSEDTDLGIILLEEDDIAFIQGSYANCYGEPLAGYLDIETFDKWQVREIEEEESFLLTAICNSSNALVRALDVNFENPTSQVQIDTEEGEVAYSGVHLTCELPQAGYLIYSIDGSDEMVIDDFVSFDINGPWNQETVSVEIEGESVGDTHTFSFGTWNFPEIQDQVEQFVDLPILEIVNGFTLIGRYESSLDFEFDYEGYSDVNGSTFLFHFSGTMNSTIGGNDIQVNGIGAVKRTE